MLQIDINTSLEENRNTKKHYQLYCSGCTRRGHLVHSCRIALPFSGLPINSPYVSIYRPYYQITPNKSIKNTEHSNKINPKNKVNSQDTSFSPKIPQKRPSKSPTIHASHINKRRNTATSDDSHNNVNTRKISDTVPQNCISNESSNIQPNNEQTADVAPDYIQISSSNHDNKGHVIQDNEVSDTSDAVTTARIYVPKDLIEKLMSPEGVEWLKAISENNNVTITATDNNSYLSVKGKVAEQEKFQTELRTWTQVQANGNMNVNNELQTLRENNKDDVLSFNIPKNKNNVLRKLNKAFASLKQDLGDPKLMFKELTYLQNHHKQLLTQKVISPKQVNNNRDNINEMFKKLNMVLIGQAGLADGTKHLNELYLIQERLANFRQKNIPKELREEIGQHYHCIFTATPRHDYSDLLKKYYGNRARTIYKKKNKNEKSMHFSPKRIQRKQFNSNFNPKSMQSFEMRIGGNQLNRQMLVEKTINKLVFFNRRILQTYTNDAVLKQTRRDLMAKLHSHITTLGMNSNVSIKERKKLKRVQAQAQLFLANV